MGCAGASWTSTVRQFEWHGKVQTMTPDDCFGYLCISFPVTLSAETRRALHSLAEAAGLHSSSHGPKGLRNLRFGNSLDCNPAAELMLPDCSELSAEEICQV